MMEIKVEQSSDKTLNDRKVQNWPIWEKEISRFDWHYDETEELSLKERLLLRQKKGTTS
jgi:hypothetical protein